MKKVSNLLYGLHRSSALKSVIRSRFPKNVRASPELQGERSATEESKAAVDKKNFATDGSTCATLFNFSLIIRLNAYRIDVLMYIGSSSLSELSLIM